MATNQKQVQLFELIVKTLMSSQETSPEIIRAHVNQYAKDAGIPYALAKNAIILVVKDRLQKRFSEL